MGVSIFSPAKINLYLAVTGRRADGYHNLVSVAAPLSFGDELEAEISGPSFAKASEGRAGSQFTMECDDPAVPVDGSNLVLKAAAAFVEATGWNGNANFKLTKRIPVGAGLGGGSSNAVAALRLLNKLSGGLLAESRLAGVAASVGSDCAMFLQGAPVVMRGRGEQVEVLTEAGAARLRGRRLLLFKPSFAISTPWAYGRMDATAPKHFVPPAEAEARLAKWVGSQAPAGQLLFNNMEAVAFEKFIALPVLLEKLRREFGVAVRMSGSGSACFALLEHSGSGSGGRPGYAGQAGYTAPEVIVTRMKQMIGECWGPQVFIQEAGVV